VADEMEALRAMAFGRGQVQDVGDQAIHAVGVEAGGGIWAHAGRIAALIRRESAIAGGSERRHLLAPRVPRLREAVKQQDERRARGAGDVRGEAAFRRRDRRGRGPGGHGPAMLSCRP
jgi:hypothetical protein